jgi:hypothetical protein
MEKIMLRKIFWPLLLTSFVIIVLPDAGVAQSQPINIALFNPIQIFPENNSIEGLRINLIYGKNVKMEGLDWGLVNHVGSGGFVGVQWGFVNIDDGNVTGWQNGALNLTRGNVKGFQWGWFNEGDYVNGFQLGLVNYANSMYGLQIGLINIIKTGGQFPVFPIVNWSF